jgi:ABC-type nickel/cobalt efflux system permease component RcnA
MVKAILVIVGIIIVLLGTIMIFDARSLTKKWFGFGDQNEATNGFKILGFIIGVIGALLIYFNVL